MKFIGYQPYKDIATVPHDLLKQLQMVIESVFCSW